MRTSLFSLSIGLCRREQLFAFQLDNVARLFNPRQSERGTAGDRAGYPGELARPERNDQQLELAAEAHCMNFTFEDHEEWCGPRTGLHEDLSTLRGSAQSVSGNSVDLARR